MTINRRPIPEPFAEPLPMTSPSESPERIAAALNQTKAYLNALKGIAADLATAIAAAVDRISDLEDDHVEEAPEDDTLYGRINGDWAEIVIGPDGEAEEDPVFTAHVAASITLADVGYWNTAYSDRLKWDGGATGLTAATGRTSLGLGNVENTALSTWAGTTNITTLGTVATCAGLTTSGSLAAAVSVNTPRIRPTGTVVYLEDSAGNQKGYFDMANSVLVWTGQVTPGSVRSNAFYAATAGGVIGFYNYVADTTEFVIDTTNHRVGVGTYTPGYKLDVNGDTRVSGSLYTTGWVVYQ